MVIFMQALYVLMMGQVQLLMAAYCKHAVTIEHTEELAFKYHILQS